MGNQCCAHLPTMRAILNGFRAGRAQPTQETEPDSDSHDDAFALSASSTSQSGD